MTATLLVTGAAGAAGSFVVPALLKAGFKVRGQFRRRPGENRDVDWRPFDFRREDDINPLVAGCDGVIHLSAELMRVEAMDQVNVTATRTLARAADAAGARYFGHASSIVVYGSPRTRRVTEATPLIDVTKPVAKQYHAEPYMLEYARTKTLGEIELTRNAGRMNVDILRPAIVADLDRLLESADWSKPRRIFALYRRTQYIYGEDAAAAVVHLVGRGLSAQSGNIEAYNICDDYCGTFRHLHLRALVATGEICFRSPVEVPVVVDVAKD